MPPLWGDIFADTRIVEAGRRVFHDGKFSLPNPWTGEKTCPVQKQKENTEGKSGWLFVALGKSDVSWGWRDRKGWWCDIFQFPLW